MKLSLIAALGFIALLPLSAQAAVNCTLIASYPDGNIIKESGDCRTPHAPASTFKLALAVMGFDSGILKDAHNPVWDYKDEYKASAREQKSVDPTIWESDSIVWYSQEITRQLGEARFKRYVDQFAYGNQDVTGTPGKPGLTHSWLFSSLLISPVGQVDFVQKFLGRDLGVSDHAYDMTLAIVPEFSADNGWRVFGKTGSGWLTDSKGKFDKTKPQGWFVGWAEQGARRIVFAKLVIDDEANAEYGGPRARVQFLQELPDIMSGDKH